MKKLIDILDYYYQDEYFAKYKTYEHQIAENGHFKNLKCFQQKLSDDLKTELNNLLDEIAYLHNLQELEIMQYVVDFVKSIYFK